MSDTCIVVVNGRTIPVDMTGATTPEEANARLAAAGVGDVVMTERRRERDAYEVRRLALTWRLEVLSERGGRIDLSPEEARHLLNAVRADREDG